MARQDQQNQQDQKNQQNQQNQQDQKNQQNQQPLIAEFTILGVTFKIYSSKWLIAIIAGGLLCGVIFFTYKSEIKSEFDRLTGSESWVQYDKYDATQQQVKIILNHWNNLESLEQRARKDVQYIFVTINGVFDRFSSLKIDKLSMGTQVYWHMDLARLYNILYDMYGDDESIELAVQTATKAKKLSTSEKLTKKDLEKFAKYQVDYQISWIFLASYTLSVSQGNHKYQGDLKKLVDELGGCETFKADPVTHKKLKAGLPC
ncbi:hypothetical protein [Pseudoalteromonas sp. S2755]|uniref:hypothetical protein n=1 Tax=Pseudoalteromonas sp. S2755 TaxID=2066523 RepID=UPI001BB12A0F|nr:hypothetical protein [Pseudoalteromonas sp. S2755]